MIHIPTFKLEETSSILLFVMCLIGLTFVNTEEAAALGVKAFPIALDKVYSEVVSVAFADVSSERRICMFTTSALMLALVILMGENSSLEKSRLLYVNTLTAARQHGLFTLNFNKPSDSPLPDTTNSERSQWSCWSRVESAKRIILCLVLADAWFSEYFSTGPISCTDYVHLFLPSDATLFQAFSAHEWACLKKPNWELCTTSFTISSRESNLPVFQKPVDSYTMQGILCSALLRIYDSYHYLFSSVDAAILLKNKYLPWRVFALEAKAKTTVGLVLQLINVYGDSLENTPSDCLVTWHQMGLLLTTNCYLLEDAAGRYGNEAASEAMSKIYVWAQTQTARRACIHAAQAFRAMKCHRPPESGFQSPNHLFHAALVLGFYILIAPRETKSQVEGSKGFELLSDVNWKSIGAEGLTEADAQSTKRSDDPAVNFIRFGGPICLDGELCLGGVRSAQRIFLDFASLLDNMKKWKIGDYSRLLYMISEKIGHLHNIPDRPLNAMSQK